MAIWNKLFGGGSKSEQQQAPTYTLLFHCEYRTNADAQTRGNAMEAAYNEMKLAAIAEGGEIVKEGELHLHPEKNDNLLSFSVRFPPDVNGVVFQKKGEQILAAHGFLQ